MPMELADGVLTYAAEIERSYGVPVLALRVESPLDRSQVAERARAAIAAVAHRETHWSVDDETAGVVIRQWGHASDIDETLAALVRALDSAGVDGRLIVHARTPERRAARTPLRKRDEALLECQLRVRGERALHVDEVALELAARLEREPPDPVMRFVPDTAAMLAGMDAALAWVGSPPPGAELLSSGELPHRDIAEVRAHLAMRVAQGSEQPWRAEWTVWWESDDEFRLMAVGPEHGNVSLAQGGRRLAAGDWEAAYSALVDALRAASSWASYGLIKRGRRPAAVGTSLYHDWFPVPHCGSRYDLRYHVYSDVLAPDAFGAQLLGPGYAGRIPDGAEWEGTDLGGDAALLVHRDLPAWFGVPMPEITPSHPTPDLILRAREDLAEILVTADVVDRAPLDPLGD